MYKEEYELYKSLYKNLKENITRNNILVDDKFYDTRSDSVDSLSDLSIGSLDLSPASASSNEYSDDSDVFINQTKSKLVQTTKKLTPGIKELGIFGLVRGKIEYLYNFSDDEFILLSQKPDKKKILLIKTLDGFDDFTEKYGKLIKNNLHINWEDVQKDYKGIYVSEHLYEERYDIAYFNNETYKSWWKIEYNFGSNVVIFVDPDVKFYKGKKIEKPFNATIYMPIEFSDKDFTKFYMKKDQNKILDIETYDDFDEFTNKYGSLIDKNKKYIIKINWNNVKKDYKGIMLNSEGEIYPSRYINAFYKGLPYLSWWKKSHLKQGLVYLFSCV